MPDLPRLFVERRAQERADRPEGRTPRFDPGRRWLGVVVLVPIALLAAGPLAALVAAVLFALAALGAALLRSRRRVAELTRLAHTDDLTGLGNARAMWGELDGLPPDDITALVFLDLDRFKHVNDSHGHAVGDAVLRATGAAVRSVTGDDGHAYRYGGEELVVVLPGAGESQAAALAERIRTRVALRSPGLPAVTVSAGVAAAGAGAGGHQMLDAADAALRRAKVAGRDRVVRASALVAGELGEDEATLAARRAAMAIASAALVARDPATGEHSDDVVLLCEAIADRLGIAGAEHDHLLAAARLHDVGKVAIPEAILGKKGPLDEAEWTIMRAHTVTGERILRAVPELEPVAPLVRSHHERFDGGGYPDGLAGEAIPLGSRVIFCADAFHAIRSDRPYRAGRPVADAVAELQAHAGTQFDPAVVATLVSIVDEVKTGTAGGGLRRAMSRSPRLMALLLTMTLGGTAMAAEPHARHAVRDVVRAIVPVQEKQRTDDPVATPRTTAPSAPRAAPVVVAPAATPSRTSAAPAASAPAPKTTTARARAAQPAASRGGTATPAPTVPTPSETPRTGESRSGDEDADDGDARDARDAKDAKDAREDAKDAAKDARDAAKDARDAAKDARDDAGDAAKDARDGAKDAEVGDDRARHGSKGEGTRGGKDERAGDRRRD